MHLDDRRLVDAQYPIIVEIALLNAAVPDRDFAEEGGGQSENHAALDLRLHCVGVDDHAAVDRANHALYAHLTILGNGDKCDLS